MIGGSKIFELNSTAKSIAIPNDGTHAETLLGMRQHKLDLYHLSALKLGGNVDGHSFFTEIMTASLQHNFAIAQDRKDFDGEVHLEASRAANLRTNVGEGS